MIMKPIPDFPGYFAGDDGEIYSTRRISQRIVPGMLPEKPRKLKAEASSKYRRVVLMRDNKRVYRKVARLVCEAFHGPKPAGMEVCHGPNGRSDDRPENVSWGTRSKNLGEDRVRDGTSNHGARHWKHGYRSGMAPL